MLAPALAVLLASGSAFAEATWQERIGTFRIGMVVELGRSSVDGLPGLRKAYTLALGVPVEFFLADDYRSLIEAQVGGRIHYGVYSAMAYATAALACDCLSPLVAPTAGNGAIGVRSVLIAREGSLSGLEAVPRHRVAIGEPDDMTGFLLPLEGLREHRASATGDEPFLVRTPSAEDAETMLVEGKVDAMFGWIETGVSRAPLPGGGTLERLEGRRQADQVFSVVWTSDLLRYGPHAIRKDLDPEVRRRLVPFLVGLKDADPEVFDTLERHHSGGFATVHERDFEAALRIVRDLAGLGE